MKRFITLFCCLPFIWLATTCAIADEINCFWTSGARLLPAWGFYPNGSSYGGTAPLGKASAWTSGGGTHTLTWVADFPVDGVWQVWVRQYGGYGEVTVEVDEEEVGGGRGGPGGGRYVWRHKGEIQVPAGSSHRRSRLSEDRRAPPHRPPSILRRIWPREHREEEVLVV